ncbi:hypothetical protein BC477_09165 [Clavibacter michiganensis subsp. michiganensis]|nr:hypothetical protein BC477_09165 [Clavibacter michiganensis subsp. michiganensis]
MGDGLAHAPLDPPRVVLERPLLPQVDVEEDRGAELADDELQPLLVAAVEHGEVEEEAALGGPGGHDLGERRREHGGHRQPAGARGGLEQAQLLLPDPVVQAAGARVGVSASCVVADGQRRPRGQVGDALAPPACVRRRPGRVGARGPGGQLRAHVAVDRGQLPPGLLDQVAEVGEEHAEADGVAREHVEVDVQAAAAERQERQVDAEHLAALDGHATVRAVVAHPLEARVHRVGVLRAEVVDAQPGGGRLLVGGQRLLRAVVPEAHPQRRVPGDQGGEGRAQPPGIQVRAVELDVEVRGDRPGRLAGLPAEPVRVLQRRERRRRRGVERGGGGARDGIRAAPDASAVAVAVRGGLAQHARPRPDRGVCREPREVGREAVAPPASREADQRRGLEAEVHEVVVEPHVGGVEAQGARDLRAERRGGGDGGDPLGHVHAPRARVVENRYHMAR